PPRQLTAAEHLDQTVLVDEAGGPEALGADLVPGQALDGVEVHDVVLDAERVLEPLELGDALLQGELTALEAGLDRVARALTLGAAAGRLAALAGYAAADPPTGSGGPVRRLELVNLHRAFSTSESSTSTRCGTRATMPRISGRSGSTLLFPIRPRPRARRVPRCFGFDPM